MYETQAKLQILSVLPSCRNLPNNKKSTKFIIVLETYNFVFSYLGLLNFSFNNLAPAKNRSRQRCGFVEVCIVSFIHLAKDLQETKVLLYQWSKK